MWLMVELFEMLRQYYSHMQINKQDQESVREAFRRADEETAWILNDYKD